jgi:hypothetical protein
MAFFLVKPNRSLSFFMPKSLARLLLGLVATLVLLRNPNKRRYRTLAPCSRRERNLHSARMRWIAKIKEEIERLEGIRKITHRAEKKKLEFDRSKPLQR